MRDAILDSYGWVDPDKGIVRIPIDQAIDIVAQKGLPSKPSPTGLDNDGYRMIPEDSSERQDSGKDFAMKNCEVHLRSRTADFRGAGAGGWAAGAHCAEREL